jgi:hypothetical protein
MVSADKSGPVVKNKLSSKFGSSILRIVQGEEKAKAAFSSISMSAIMRTGSAIIEKKPYNNSASAIQKSHSLNEIGALFNNKLAGFKEKLDKAAEKVDQKKKEGKSGLDAYIAEDSDESNDSFEDAKDPNCMSMVEEDPRKLIDLDLVNLLRYCKELNDQKEDDEEYQDEVMLKSFQLGTKTKPKTLIFDMDETLVAAKFEGNIPETFEENFKF